MSTESTEEGRLELADKEILFVEDQTWNGLYKVEKGVIEIYRERNGKLVVLSLEGEGSLIGTATLLSRQPRMASARAKGPTVVWHLEKNPAETLLNSMPPWGKAIIRDLLNHLDTLDDHFVEAWFRAESQEPLEKVPVVAVQKFLEGLCWTQGYRKAMFAGNEIEVVPVGDVGAWLGPVMRIAPEKVRMALRVLESSHMIRLEEIEGLGLCVLRH